MSIISLAEYKGSVGQASVKKTKEIIYLPVAPQITARTRFASAIPKKISFMMPNEAMSVLDSAVEKQGDRIGMVAICGPGDPFAVPDTTLKTIEMVRKKYPEVEIALGTLGIGAEKFATEFASAGVGYVEMTVNAVDAKILERLYAWIRPGLKTLKISDAVKLLVNEQRNGVPALKYAGISVGIATTLYPGYNTDHVKKISERMMEYGADSISLLPYHPEPGAEVNLELPDEKMISKAEKTAEKFLKVTEAVLGFRGSRDGSGEKNVTGRLPGPSGKKVNVAVASSTGMDVDLHLGQADRFLIYGPREDGLPCLLEVRNAPEPGGGSQRWGKLANVLHDCFAVLAASAGETPRKSLGEQHISVILTDENVEGSVDVLYGGGRKGKKNKRKYDSP